MQVHVVTVLFFLVVIVVVIVGLQLFKTLIHIRDLIEWIWVEEGHKPMKDLTPDEQLAYSQATNCHICEQPIISQLTQQQYDKWLKEENQERPRHRRRRLLPENLGPKGKLLSPPPPPHNLFSTSQGSLSLDWPIYW